LGMDEEKPIKFFRPDDFGEFACAGQFSCYEPETIPEGVARIANAKLEASFGNEYSIVMFWKEKLEEERREVARLRDSLERIIALSHSWVIAEQTIDCQHTYDQIRMKARAALAGTELTEDGK